MPLDVGEHVRVAVEVERILADEVALEVGEAVHRVARPDADVSGVVVDSRTIVVGKRVRGRVSHEAGNGGSSGS